MDITISKKGHNSGTPLPNITKQMSCTKIFFRDIMYINFHLDAFTTVIDLLD